MHIMTRKKWWGVGLVLVAIFVYIFSSAKDIDVAHTETETENSIVHEKVYLATSTLNLRVSGTVDATDSAVVSAKTGGVIASQLVQEGDMAAHGTLLVVQSTPVADAEVRLQETNNFLSEVKQRSQITSLETARDTAEVGSMSATDIAELRMASSDNRVQEATDALMTTLQSDVTTIIDAFEFVDTHRSLFTGASVRQYEELVYDLYGTVPDFLDDRLRQSFDDSSDLLAKLEEYTHDGETVSVTDVQNLSALFDTQITLLEEVYKDGEYDFLDEHAIDSDGALYTSYMTRRSTLSAAQSALREKQALLRTALDAAREDMANQGVAVVVVGNIDREGAEAQVAFGTEIAAALKQVGDAAADVAVVQRTLGNVTAPFAGVVTDLYKEVGEYASPGEPLLKIEGVAGQEMTVTVPNDFGELLEVGQSFKVDGEVAGVVDRFSPVSTGNGLKVVILLSIEGLRVGASLVGELEIETTGNNYSLPRSYVHFSGTGLYVLDETGQKYPVSLFYDAGSTVFIRSVVTTDAPLVPSYSIDLD